MSTNETKEQVNMDERQEDVMEQESEVNETSAAGNEQPTAEEVSEDNARVAELQRQADDHYNRYLRTQADFDNFRRRSTKEKEELAQYASMKLITQLLPVMDNFERAFQAGGEGADSSFAKGVDMIYRQFTQVMDAEGLQRMEAEGQPFDPEYHQAIMRVESEDHEEGIVVEVVQTGYMLKDKVIRPAMVKVSG
ncbi:nucleotide exchange factor GrpE [Cohnella terricola]|uniref:Protein GrpE n=1 Tax=Cohnella terricola TaxID=1289167 RepID=A0A559JKW0_9BACL|nr:nucleotide exchange factor GrpE [Cohnella terricola]TVY00509.1 nucleotide exchange factor GrpE [Cohnella terricola]